MEIKVEGLELIKKDVTYYINGDSSKFTVAEIEGMLDLKISHNKIESFAEYNLNKISAHAKRSLINSLKLIEDELNSVE